MSLPPSTFPLPALVSVPTRPTPASPPAHFQTNVAAQTGLGGALPADVTMESALSDMLQVGVNCLFLFADCMCA